MGRVIGALVLASMAAGCRRSEEGEKRTGGEGGAATAAMALAPSPPATDDAGAGFQGSIALSVTVTGPETGDHDQQESFHFVARGAKVRWPIEDGYAYRVYDGEARTISTVFPKEKAVQVVHVEALARDAGATSAAWTFTTFDPHGVIADQPCERVHATAPGLPESDACVAHDLPELPLELLSPSLATAVPFAPALRARGLFPLAATTRPAADAGALPAAARGLPPRSRIAPIRSIVLRIERRPVAADEVSVPPYPVQEGTSLNAPPPRLR